MKPCCCGRAQFIDKVITVILMNKGENSDDEIDLEEVGVLLRKAQKTENKITLIAMSMEQRVKITAQVNVFAGYAGPVPSPQIRELFLMIDANGRCALLA